MKVSIYKSDWRLNEYDYLLDCLIENLESQTYDIRLSEMRLPIDQELCLTCLTDLEQHYDSISEI